mmetsp:Transcript_45235/g.110137  ORF Transcript_45235/g.110137 Transcript_45235/m.110137 type:complete len:518 (+) Transcript_45235:40-1593(+)
MQLSTLQVTPDAAGAVKVGKALACAYGAYLALKALRSALALARDHYILCKIPHPPCPSLLLGNLPEISKEPPGVPFLRWHKEHGMIYTYRMMHRRKIVIADQVELKKVLLTNVREFVKPKMEMVVLNFLLGEWGLVSVEGKDHTRQRKILSEAFSFEALQGTFPTFTHYADKLVDRWGKFADEGRGDVDVDNDLQKVTLDVIGKAAFGVEFGALEGDKSEVRDAYDSVFAMGGGQVLRILSQIVPLIGWLPLPAKRRMEKAERVVNAKVNGVIEQRKAQKVEGGKGKDLLSLMMQARDGAGKGDTLSDIELAHNVKTFMFAGHETTAGTLAWVLFELSKDKKLVERIRAEVKSVVSDGKSITFRDTEKMPLLNAVFKETLRIYPAAPQLFRQTASEQVMCGYTIPAGTQVLVSPYVMGRSSEFWERAEEFWPDRWLEGIYKSEDDRANPYRFLPFLLGARHCIGSKFANVEGAIILASVIREFDFELMEGHDEVKAKSKPTLKVHPYLKMKITRASK